MKRFITAAAVLLTLTVASGLATAGSSGFKTRLGCGKNDGPSRSCPKGSDWGASFKAETGVRTRYKLCVVPPDGYGTCSNEETDRRGKDFVSLGGWRIAGAYVVSWEIGGDVVGRDRLTLRR